MIPADQVRPRRLWYGVAAALGVVLAGVAVALLVVTVKGATGVIDPDSGFRAGSSRTLQVTAGEKKAVYVEQTGAGKVDCRARGTSSGKVTRPDSTFHVTLGSRTWERVFELHPARSGSLTLTCTAEREAEFAVGEPPEVGSMVGGIFGTVGFGLAALMAPAAICIVTAVRRNTNRRNLAATWHGPPPHVR
ncbi:serine/arginine repetitive matrix protein 2 [Streptomyces sp. ODS28]|uniref:serine/arginine repetitive matrix protein 2 n=1 Tax=Streptomyces sp. ODS28 TaxID=3136688 RepID=UPI0031EE50AD